MPLSWRCYTVMLQNDRRWRSRLGFEVGYYVTNQWDLLQQT